MIVLKIICLAITVITCVVNVIYLVNATRTFSDRFYEKLGNYDDRKLEKYKNGLYDYSDIQMEALKRDDVFSLMLLKQFLISLLFSVCGTITFFLGAHNFAKTNNYMPACMLSLLVIFFIMLPILMVIYVKKAKKLNIRLIHKYSPGLGGVIVPADLILYLAVCVSLSLGTVIGIIPIIFGL